MSAGTPLRELARPRNAPGPTAGGSPHYACLLEVVQAVNSTLQLQSVLNLILDRAIEVMQADAGSIMMLDESTGELEVKVARGARAAEVYGRSVKLGEGIEWTHEVPVLPKWFEFSEGAAVPAAYRYSARAASTNAAGNEARAALR